MTTVSRPDALIEQWLPYAFDGGESFSFPKLNQNLNLNHFRCLMHPLR
jgi:hypothetical protein